MQDVFKRYEKKYLITTQQAAIVEAVLSARMVPDRFDAYWVQNLYFDTDNWDVIRTSMQRPYYKEKLRLRYYGVMDANSSGPVFLELKKKCAGIAYKRRIALPQEVLAQSLGEVLGRETTQIARELQFYLRTTEVAPKLFVAYRRRAFAGKEDVGLRVTLDAEIRYRSEQLHFHQPDEGRLVLPETHHLMEIKTPTSIPLWLARLCSDNGIFAGSYSKYATCYTDYWQRTHVERAVEASA